MAQRLNLGPPQLMPLGHGPLTSRGRAQTWRHLFVTPCTSLRPCWTALLRILQCVLTRDGTWSPAYATMQESSFPATC